MIMWEHREGRFSKYKRLDSRTYAITVWLQQGTYPCIQQKLCTSVSLNNALSSIGVHAEYMRQSTNRETQTVCRIVLKLTVHVMHSCG